MVRRTRKRSKNKKGGSFMDKFKQGTTDIGKGLQDARRKAGETYAGAQQGMTDFNEARKAQYQSKVTAIGGDGEKISLFEKKPQALLKPRRPVFPTQDPPTLIKQANEPTGSTIIGRGGKRKTRRKKRRKNKKRKTKKRRRKRKTKRKRRR